ncbi:MAG: DUF4097 family beta strand repeat protein [Candidatus Latescibacterota bacterium]|nr:MAG: DUF4097 family beta strand repeat protein [Candidatus Latescibacterota bacterium]
MDYRRTRPGKYMPTGFAVIALMVTLSCPAFSADNRSPDPEDLVYSEEFALSPAGKLSIDVDDMDIRVETGTGAPGRVEVYITGRDRDKAEEWLERSKFEARLDGNHLLVQSRDPDSAIFGFGNLFDNMRVLAVVSIPKQIAIDIRTEDGDVRIGEIKGDARVITEDGDLDLAGIHGGTIEIDSEDGDIDAESLTADDVTISTEDGDVDIDVIQSEGLRVSSSDGDIKLAKIDGGVTFVETSDGDIEFAVSGTRLKVRCSDGDLTATLLSGIEADIKTSDGDVDLYIPKGTAADIDLRGGSVSVRDVSVKGSVTDETIQGSINEGGPLIRVRTDDGSIRIRER